MSGVATADKCRDRLSGVTPGISYAAQRNTWLTCITRWGMNGRSAATTSRSMPSDASIQLKSLGRKFKRIDITL